MAEIVACPACGRKLQVPEAYFGQTVQCPDCAHQFTAEPHVEKVQTAPRAAASPSRSADRYDDDDRPLRRRDFRDDFDDDDDDFGELRPLRRRRGTPHRGGLILALGLISLVGGISIYLPFVLGPVAWIMGNSDMAEIHAGRMDPSGEGMVQAGRVLGIISTAFLVIGLVGMCLIFGLIALAGA